MSDTGKVPSDADEFNEELKRIVSKAVMNGIDIEGAWDVSTGAANGNPHPDFTVEIYYIDGS